jgi:hypothetical protein
MSTPDICSILAGICSVLAIIGSYILEWIYSYKIKISNIKDLILVFFTFINFGLTLIFIVFAVVGSCIKNNP